MDFQAEIVETLAGGDAEVHTVLTEKIFPSQATMMSVEEFVGALITPGK